jgi:glycosyltransferase involved in cell wall biosynthesis
MHRLETQLPIIGDQTTSSLQMDVRETRVPQKTGASSPLDIAFVTMADLPEGGGNTARLKMLATAVAACGHRVSLLNEHRLGIAPPELLKASGYMGPIEYHYVRRSIERQFGWTSVPGKLAAVLSLARTIVHRYRARQIDVLWFNSLSFYDTWPLTKIAQRLGIPTIQSYEDERRELLTHERSLRSTVLALNARMADRFCPRLASAIIVISEYLKKKYSDCADKSRTDLIPTIVDCHYWSVGQEPKTDPPKLLYAGCFGEQDEIENLLDALVLLKRRGRCFRAAFLGSNRDVNRVAEVRSGIEARDLKVVVEMKGFQPVDTVRRHIAESNILLNIRRDGIWSRSGLSTKLSEYLASGRAVVCTALGDVPRYLEHGRSAIFVPPTATASEIASAIDQALASPQLRRRIGEAGREVARRYFDIAAVSEKLDLVLHSVLNVPGGGKGT